MERAPSVAAGLVLAVCTSGCGSGPGLAFFGLGGSGGSGSAPSPTLVSDAQVVSSTRVSPVSFSFRLSDQDSDAATVTVWYTPPGNGPTAPALLVGAPSLTGMATAPGGVVHVLQWDFAAQLPSGDGYAQGTRLAIRLGDGSSESETPVFDVGNDAPSLAVTSVPSGEQAGVIPIGIVVTDSSSDLVSLVVEYDDASAPTGWKPATPASPPVFTTTPTGTAATYFWDSRADEPDARIDALLRFQPDDGVDLGPPVLAGPVELDNNAEPVVQINGSAFFSTPDGRRGIPVPFRTFDAEGDPTRVVFQWRRPLEAFPALPADRATLDAALTDPVVRRSLHIATERPTAVTGRAQPRGADSIRLPELRTHGIPRPAVTGRALELLREPGPPVVPAGSWAPSLISPVCLLPYGDGDTALALDRPAPGNWLLRKVDLATGAVRADLASGTDGDPSALFQDEAAASIWLATDQGGPWTLWEVDPDTGASAVRFMSSGAIAAGPVRSLASVGTDTVWVTAADALVSVDVVAGTEAVLLGGLQSPWGLCRDTRRSRRLFLAERDWTNPATSLVEGRILAVDRLTLETTQLSASSGPGLPRPSSLALEGEGTRLLGVTDSDPLDGTQELRAITLAGEGIGSSQEIASALIDASWTVTTGPDLLRVLTSPGPQVLVSGGLQQVREIVDYAPDTTTAVVAADFDPPPTASQRWRIRDGVVITPAGSTIVDDVFVWDSSDVGVGGEVVLQAVPYDAEPGLASDTGPPRSVKASIDVAPMTLGGPGLTDGATDAVLADLDGDGLVDVATANSGQDSVSVFFGTGGGILPAAPDLSLTGIPLLAPVTEPVAVAAVDVDDDGDLDLVSCNRGSNNVTFFLQTLPRTFTTSLTTISLSSPSDLAAADINGDGRTDIAVADTGADRLAVFLQLAGGLFLPFPSSTPGAGVVVAPVAVVAADFDADGDIDLASANRDGNDLALFLGSGGTLPASPSAILGGTGITDGPSALAFGDIDGDGRLDIVCANRAGNSLAVFMGQLSGPFAAVPTHLLASSVGPSLPDSVALLDVTSDGFLDAVAIHAGSGLVVFSYDDASGSFSDEVLTMDVAGTLVGARSLSGADVDGDGATDLAIANELGSDVVVLVQRGAGHFEPFEPDLRLGSPLDLSQVERMAAADIDGDGDLDLITANRGADTLTVFESFSPSVLSSEPAMRLGPDPAIDEPTFVAAGDLDGDGRLDLAASSAANGSLVLFLQVAGGGFTSVPDQSLGSGVLVDPTWIELVDLDADGDADILCADAGGNQLHVFLGDGTGSFPALPTQSVGGAGSTAAPACLALADLDRDGDLDVVTANTGGDDLAVFLAQPAGVLPSTPSAVLGGAGVTNAPRAVALLDVDNDGDVDVVSANEGSDSLTVFLQTGGTFSVLPDIVLTHASLQAPTSLATADLDQDGLPDLVVASATTASLLIFRQVSPAVFTARPEPHGGPGFLVAPRSVVARDLDGDGDVDLLAVDPSLGQVVVYFNSH
jgi:FG-GAP-like repeat